MNGRGLALFCPDDSRSGFLPLKFGGVKKGTNLNRVHGEMKEDAMVVIHKKCDPSVRATCFAFTCSFIAYLMGEKKTMRALLLTFLRS